MEQKKLFDKKGQGFNLLMGGIVSFVVIGVMIVVGININSTLGANYAVNTAERNASTQQQQPSVRSRSTSPS